MANDFTDRGANSGLIYDVNRARANKFKGELRSRVKWAPLSETRKDFQAGEKQATSQ